MKTIHLTSLALVSSVMLCSCASGPNAQSGTLIGAGTGALAGGIIGHQSGNTAAGAVIGGVAGGAIGNAIGDSQDRRNYYGHRHYRY